MPCCGKAISKFPLYECVKDQLGCERKCPNCSKSIGGFDILNALDIIKYLKYCQEI